MTGSKTGTAPPPNSTATPRARASAIVCIGSSTGGPGALCSLLKAIRTPLKCPIVIVQHMDQPFFEDLAQWLSHSSGHRVQIACEGVMPQAGEIFLAGRADHLTLLPSGQLHYLPALPSDIHRPSIDIFFSSVAAAWPRSGSAILLTGMGRDGAAGLLKLRQQGFSTLAQSESSCIVYGMPKAGYDCGAVQELLSPSEIGLWLHRRYSPDSIAHTQAAPRSKAQFDRVALQRLVALRPARISKER